MANRITMKPESSAPRDSMPATISSRRQWGLLLALALLAFLPYLPTLRNGLLLWDDAPYLTNNYRIQQFNLANIVDLFRLRPQRGQMPNGQYTPLVELSYMLEHRFFGLAPGIYHLNNLLLHALNTGLVFLFVRRLTRKELWAWLTACFFAVHPLHVESVAWVTERKDMLSASFYLFALLAYLRHRDGEANSCRWVALVAGIAAFLSKPLAVTLPAACILCDYYRQGFLDRKTVLRLWPCWVLSAGGVWITLYTHVSTNVAKSHELADLGVNLLVAARGIAHYVEKFIWPFRLSAFYPVPEPGQPFDGSYYAALIVLLASLGALGWAILRRRHRTWVFGFLFFLVVLSPSSRIIPVGVRFLAADRFFYLPGIGFFLLLAWGLHGLLRMGGGARWGAVGLSIALGLLWASRTWQRSKVWFDDETLWRDALAIYPESSNVLGNLAQGLLDRNPEEAERFADKALAIAPGDGQTMLAKAILAHRAGEYEKSLDWLEKAAALDASPTAIADLRGKIYSLQGEYKKAILAYSDIVAIEPQSVKHYGFMALASLALGDEGGAQECLQEMIRLDADVARHARLLAEHVPLYSELSLLQRLVVLIPGLMRHQYDLAQNSQFFLKDSTRAIREYGLLLQYYPPVVDVWRSAAELLPPSQHPPQIIDIRDNHVRKLAVAFYNQGCLLAVVGNPSEALAALRKAIHYDGTLAANASRDSDLVGLRDLPEFREMMRANEQPL